MSLDEKIEKTKRKIKSIDKVRVMSLVIALLILTCIWLGNKLLEGALWYQNALVYMYQVVGGAIIIMAISVLLKFYFYNKYRILLRKKKLKHRV